jgi:hypothetical protein
MAPDGVEGLSIDPTAKMRIAARSGPWSTTSALTPTTRKNPPPPQREMSAETRKPREESRPLSKTVSRPFRSWQSRHHPSLTFSFRIGRVQYPAHLVLLHNSPARAGPFSLTPPSNAMPARTHQSRCSQSASQSISQSVIGDLARASELLMTLMPNLENHSRFSKYLTSMS